MLVGNEAGQLTKGFPMYKPNQILENVLSNGSVVVVRVVGTVPGFTNTFEHGIRVTDARNTEDDLFLIRNDLTWCAPFENLREHDATLCSVCQGVHTSSKSRPSTFRKA